MVEQQAVFCSNITETSSGGFRKLLKRADPPEMEETEEGGAAVI